MRTRIMCILALLFLALAASSSFGQSPAPASTDSTAPAGPSAAAPAPLPTPSMSGPLQTAVPHEVEGGKLAVTGILSAVGWTEGNHITGDDATHFDISNAQLFVQKTSGWWQFYLQGGAYNLPAIGVPFLSTADTIKNIYGPFPQGYAKFVKGNFNVEVGALPTLIGAEYTFSFENMNVERGLLWGQENAVNRGIQLNETYKKWTLALSWNDGFYSNRYTWLTGSVTYAFNSANSLAFVGGGNAGSYAKSTLATPLALNNSQIYNVIYTYTKGNWVVQPYLQITDVPTNANIGITQGAGTRGGALLLTYNFKRGFSLAPRFEYISTTGSVNNGAVNLLYGPGSGAYSFTITPTYRKDAFFLRGDLAIVHVTSMTPGFGFGTSGANATQPRGVVEAGFMF
ncbi:MAG TPA: outer membrane beta-barrel protein [Terriglobales bacterium]|nr:outer membrane beta-barrel protein [Terriglobales bacterium]